MYCFFNVVSYYLSFAPFVVPDPKRTLGPLPPQRTLKKKEKTDPKKSTPETHKKWKIRLGWLFFVVGCTWIDVFGVCVCVLFFSTENTGFYEFVCVCVFSAVDCGCTQLLTHGKMHDVCWQEGRTTRWNREILYIVSWQKQIRDMDHNMFFVRKILYIYIYPQLLRTWKHVQVEMDVGIAT